MAVNALVCHVHRRGIIYYLSPQPLRQKNAFAAMRNDGVQYSLADCLVTVLVTV